MIAAIVLAAGLSTRMGRAKLILPVRGKTMLERVLDTYRGARVDDIVVVLGANAEQIRSSVRFDEERVVFNPEYRRGMSGSLKLGIEALTRETEAAIIALGDQPFLSSKTVDRLVDEYLATKAPIVAPVYRGQRGNPVLFDRSLFSQIREIDGDKGAKSVVLKNEAKVREVAVEDEGVLLDIDTPSDYEKARTIRPAPRRTRTRGRA